ncbi:hypothetical protein HY631_02205 [Candidatus Uhrbacteria bacterium]|nr:hypothetical protein [Candidatus Uhrbacteria bacterium]
MPLAGLHSFLFHASRVVVGAVLGTVWASVTWLSFLWYAYAFTADAIELVRAYAMFIPVGAPIGIVLAYESKDTFGPWCHVEAAFVFLCLPLTTVLCGALSRMDVPEWWMGFLVPFGIFNLICWSGVYVFVKLNRHTGWVPVPERERTQEGSGA